MTINIDEDIKEEWLQWVKTDFIPSLNHHQLVKSIGFFRLLTEIEGQGFTYSIQLFFENNQLFEEYDLNYFPLQLEKIYAKFNGKFVEFRSILEKETF
jgi:hypothetical protein